MGKKKYIYETLIAAAREDVWNALTMAEFTRQYWHSTRVNSDWAVGSRIEFLVDGENGDEVGCEGEILKCDYPAELSYTWQFPRNPDTRDEAPSRVTFLLESVGEYTKLSVIHDRFPEGSRMYEMVSGGWIHVIAGLKTLLETGRAVDFSKYMGPE
jgi:uncharacterized protein YndB with AHSA1/START domain